MTYQIYGVTGHQGVENFHSHDFSQTFAKSEDNLKPVLWIRIRKNPKKSSESNSDPGIVVEWKFVWKIEDQRVEEKNLKFFYCKN
jgi:hypothetical protein